jgi:hypothetical protein
MLGNHIDGTFVANLVHRITAANAMHVPAQARRSTNEPGATNFLPGEMNQRRLILLPERIVIVAPEFES